MAKKDNEKWEYLPEGRVRDKETGAEGVIRTIGGRKVFIKDGQDLASAMIESGKFDKKGNMRSNYRKQKEKDYKEQDELYEKYKKANEETSNVQKEASEYMKKVSNNNELYEDTYEKRAEKENRYAKVDAKRGETKPYREEYRENPYRKESQERKENLDKVNKLTKEQENEEYSLYKRAKERPESIDPMTEHSTDWEKLENKYKDRYNDESKKYRTAKELDMEENYHTEFIEEAKNHEKDSKEYNEQQRRKELISQGLTEEEIDKGYTNVYDALKDKNKNKSTNEKFGYNDARDILNQLNDEGSDFTFGEIEVDKYNQNYKDTGKLKTEVSVFMPDERGYTTRELEIPIDKNETRASFEEKLRDWQSRHSSPDTWEDEDFKSTNDNSFDVRKYDVQVKHDNGTSTISVTASDEDSARKSVMKMENAPESAIIGVKDKGSILNKSTNETMNNAIREKASKKTQGLSYIDSKRKAQERKYSADEQDILDRYGEDYGYPKGDNLKNLKGQIDYMRIPNESIHKTAERLVEGGDFLIYNEDIKDWLKERNIKHNDDNFFDVYKKEMADTIEKLYNQESNESMNSKIRSQANIKNEWKQYLKDHPESKMSLKDFRNMKK